jgi:glucosamine--fructose-6-phosphate aminotransferase (isomerizing)
MTTFRRLHGLNAVAVLDVQTGQLAAAKNGSPLVLGWSDSGSLLASDYTALLEHTRRVTFVEDGQAALVGADSIRLFDVATEAELRPEITQVEWEAADAELAGYPDYMTKEIHEQPAVLRRIAAGWGEHASRLAALLREAREVFVVGCGTAGHAALAAQYLLGRIAGRRVTFVAGSEFAYLRDFVTEGSLVIALSQSGETIDVIDAAQAGRSRGARIAALVNVEGSTLWRMADCAVPLGAGPERCVLATKSFTAKLAVLLRTAYMAAGQPEVGASLVRDAAD